MPHTASPSIAILNGGEWLLKPTAPDAVFTPERLTEEHRLIAQTVTDFVTGEVLPLLDRLEQKDWAFARTLLRRCGGRLGWRWLARFCWRLPPCLRLTWCLRWLCRSAFSC